jgi:hypothetical protein
MIGGVVKESSGGGEFKYDILIHRKKLCKCYNVPPPSTTIKKEIKKNKLNGTIPIRLSLLQILAVIEGPLDTHNSN